MEPVAGAFLTSLVTLLAYVFPGHLLQKLVLLLFTDVLSIIAVWTGRAFREAEHRLRVKQKVYLQVKTGTNNCFHIFELSKIAAIRNPTCYWQVSLVQLY